MEKAVVRKEIIDWVATLEDESTLMILEGVKETQFSILTKSSKRAFL